MVAVEITLAAIGLGMAIYKSVKKHKRRKSYNMIKRLYKIAHKQAK
jgi:hypothetical protein